MKLTVREIVIFSVLGAIMYVSKIAMEFLPNIHLVAVFVIALTHVYRKKAIYPLYIFVFLCGLFSAFSAWWLPYTYIWLVPWFCTMLVPRRLSIKSKTLIYMFICALHGLLYGILYAPVHMIVYNMSMSAITAWVVAGLPWDLLHGVGNFFCGLLIYPIIKAVQSGERYGK